MKITIYELLGLVKDGKAPKKIKYDDKIWDYRNDSQDYSCFNGNDLIGRLFYSLPTNEFINDEVEIIEESKKIEKCKDYEIFLGIDDYIEYIKTRAINELMDEINNLKENDNNE